MEEKQSRWWLSGTEELGKGQMLVKGHKLLVIRGISSSWGSNTQHGDYS